MKEFIIKHKLKLIIIGILLLLYILIPMSIRAVMPFEICEYDPAEVIAIEVVYEGTTVMIDEPEQISQLIGELNEKRYFFWLPDMDMIAGSRYILHIYKGERLKDVDTWFLQTGSAQYIEDGLVLFSDMEFITSLIPD